MDKPFKGRLYNAVKRPGSPNHGLGFYYVGRFADHPQYRGSYGHTSYVVAEGEVMDDDGSYEIETRNSRYIVIPA